MSRFDLDNDDGIAWGMWENIVSRALGGPRGQAALAELESALVALPAPRLIEGHLAAHRPGRPDNDVCAVGAYVAARRAADRGVGLADAIAELADEGDPDYEDANATADAGHSAGLAMSVAWHLAYLNDETFEGLTPEDRYQRVLTWVRRAQGRPDGVT